MKINNENAYIFKLIGMMELPYVIILKTNIYMLQLGTLLIIKKLIK